MYLPRHLHKLPSTPGKFLLVDLSQSTLFTVLKKTVDDIRVKTIYPPSLVGHKGLSSRTTPVRPPCLLLLYPMHFPPTLPRCRDTVGSRRSVLAPHPSV